MMGELEGGTMVMTWATDNDIGIRCYKGEVGQTPVA